jgi:hypothetical protein
MLWYIFGIKPEEVMEGWRKLHSKKHNDLYYPSNIIRMIDSRRMRWAQHVAGMGKKLNAYRVLVWKSEGNRLLGRPRRGWGNNIKWILSRICGGLD